MNEEHDGTHQTTEQWAAFQQIWGETFSKMMQLGFTFSPESAPPEFMRQMRSGIFQALGAERINVADFELEHLSHERGGTLTVVRSDVELEVLASDIPDHITVDLTGRKMGDVIHINDVVLPEGVRPTIARNFVIANIAAPSGYVETEE